MTIVAGAFGQFPHIVDYPAIACPVDGVAIHAPSLSIEDLPMEYNLHVFSLAIWFLILLSILFFTVYLRLTAAKQFHNRYLYDVSACYVNQANVSGFPVKTRLLLALFLINAFVVTEVFEQSVGTEKVAKDFSKVIVTLDDLEWIKDYVPQFIKGHPLDHLFKSTNAKRYKRVWKRAEEIGIEKCEFNMEQVGVVDSSKLTFFDDVTGVVYSKYKCSQNPNLKLWKVKETVTEVLGSYYANKLSNKNKRQFIRNK